jgi:dTDP-4-dehydrorhamnose 3,5-epimerase
MFSRLAIPDLVLVEPYRHIDERGWFVETYKTATWREGGIADVFVQDNQSMSRNAGTVRGLHFQASPAAQAKLVRCTAGAIFDVAVDIRRSSPTFGRHVAAELSAENGRQMYIPVGFAHGYCTLSPDTVVDYKVSHSYDPTSERGIVWNDPDLAIPWPLPDKPPHVSARDQSLPRLSALAAYF